MSATYKYNFTRWSLRGKSDLMSITAMPAMTTLAYDRMAAAQWIEVAQQESDLPPHDWSQSGFLDTYDAAKYCGDYASGKQIAYACAACYSIKLPADALAGTAAKVEAILATVYGDRWLSEGAILSAFLTASATPPAWADIVDGSTALASSPDPAPAADAVTVPDWGAPLRQITRSNTAPDNDYAATLAPATATNATAYLHVVIRLSDYISVPQLTLSTGGTRDSAWIEGGAKIDGTTLAVQFDRAVTPDGQATIELMNEFQHAGNSRSKTGMTPAIDNTCQITLSYAKGALAPTKMLGDSVMMRRLIEQREAQSVGQMSSLGSGVDAGNNVFVNFSFVGALVGVTYTSDADFTKYRLNGMCIARQAHTHEQVVDGVSLDVDMPALPVGMMVRVSVYSHEGVIPPAIYSGDDGYRVMPTIISMGTMASSDFLLGRATTAKLGYVSSSDASVSLDRLLEDSASGKVSVDIPLVPLGTLDLNGSGILAGTKIPFSAAYKLPRFCVIFVSFAVIGFSDEWVAAPAVNSVVDFKPSSIFLHIV